MVIKRMLVSDNDIRANKGPNVLGVHLWTDTFDRPTGGQLLRNHDFSGETKNWLEP